VATIMKSEPTPPDREVLTGLVERVTYQNAENGFCVLRVKARGSPWSAMPPRSRPASGLHAPAAGLTIAPMIGQAAGSPAAPSQARPSFQRQGRRSSRPWRAARDDFRLSSRSGRGFHADGPALVAREPETVEYARVARDRAACLLDPPMRIISSASGATESQRVSGPNLGNVCLLRLDRLGSLSQPAVTAGALDGGAPRSQGTPHVALPVRGVRGVVSRLLPATGLEPL